MLLCSKIFGKEIDLITLDDLKAYFKEERVETHMLEFKSGDVNISDLYKEICAFLNTDGGVIIIGTPREKKVLSKNETYRICQGDLVPSSIKGKTWLEQHIAAHIVPFPEEIIIKELYDQAGGYFIMDIPRSQTSPHQFKNDGRYYIRVQEEARPAPHGIIKALFYKNEKPYVKIKMHIVHDKVVDTRLNVILTIENKSNMPISKFNFKVDVINVKSIHTGNREGLRTFDNHFTDQQIITDTVHQELNYKWETEIEHYFQPLIIYTTVWNSDAGVVTRGILYDPSNGLNLTDTDKINKPVNLREMKQQLDELTRFL